MIDMTENKILIYAGTTEGRRLAEFFSKKGSQCSCLRGNRIWRESAARGK